MQPVVEEFKRMSEERFLALYESLTEQGFGPLDANVAKALKFRPHAIRKLPLAQRARKARAILLGANEAELAYELAGTYLVKHHRKLITDFLDATGVAHEDGMIEDLEAGAPADDQLAPAVAALDGEFATADVTLYLSMCVQQWPTADTLRELWQAR